MPIDVMKKEGVLPVLLGLLALAAASYVFLFAPELRKIRDLKAEISRKEAEAADAKALRAAVEGSRAGGGNRWESRLRSWEERVPSTAGPERVLSELAELAARHRLRSLAMAVVPDAPNGDAPEAGAPEGGAEGAPARLMEVRYRMTFRCAYRDLAEFLEDIPGTRRLLSVRAVSIKGEEDVMAAMVELSAWHRGAR